MAGQALALRPVARRATGSWEARCPGPTHIQPVRSHGVAVSGHQHGFHFPRGRQCPAKPRDPCLEQQTRQHPGRALHQGERPFHQKLETKLFCSLEKKKQKFHHQECLLSSDGNCETVSQKERQTLAFFCFHDPAEDYGCGLCPRREAGCSLGGTGVAQLPRGAKGAQGGTLLRPSRVASPLPGALVSGRPRASPPVCAQGKLGLRKSQKPRGSQGRGTAQE